MSVSFPAFKLKKKRSSDRPAGAVLQICVSSREHPPGLETGFCQRGSAGHGALGQSSADGHREQGRLQTHEI